MPFNCKVKSQLKLIQLMNSLRTWDHIYNFEFSNISANDYMIYISTNDTNFRLKIELIKKVEDKIKWRKLFFLNI